MKNKKVVAGTLAAAAAGALFFLPGTTALWSDAVTVGGGTITAGNLDVAALGDTTWQDVSVPGTPENIDLATFVTVPGDVLQSSRDLDVALEGDNMAAEFNVEMGAGATGALMAGLDTDVDPTETGVTQDALSAAGITLTYTVTDENEVVIGEADTAPGTPTEVTLTPANVAATVDTVADYNVSITATFDSATPERTRVMTEAVLEDMNVSLTQVRPTATP